jgi:hypothetical protein
MNRQELMTYLNHHEIRICYRCGITYRVRDWRNYYMYHKCKIQDKNNYETAFNDSIDN